MDIGLRSTFVISAIAHALIVAPFYHQNLLKNDFAKQNSVVVDYLILKEMTGGAATNITTRSAAAEAPEMHAGGIEIKNAAPQIKPAAKFDKAAYKKRLEARKHRERQGALKGTAQTAALEAAKNQTQTKANREYVSYYELLKDKIKTRLQYNYRFYKGEGDVYLSFALGADGKLLAYGIDRQRSSKDDVLLQIASASLKGASPFQPLPKAIAGAKTSFNIIISFKK